MSITACSIRWCQDGGRVGGGVMARHALANLHVPKMARAYMYHTGAQLSMLAEVTSCLCMSAHLSGKVSGALCTPGLACFCPAFPSCLLFKGVTGVALALIIGPSLCFIIRLITAMSASHHSQLLWVLRP